MHAGAGEVSAIGWYSVARNETLVATGHADGRVLLLLIGTEALKCVSNVSV